MGDRGSSRELCTLRCVPLVAQIVVPSSARHMPLTASACKPRSRSTTSRHETASSTRAEVPCLLREPRRPRPAPQRPPPRAELTSAAVGAEGSGARAPC